MKVYYDRKAKYRCFAPRNEVLVLLSIQGHPLAARYSGPYAAERRVGEFYYLFVDPDRRKRAQLCHVNMMKPDYHKNSQQGSLVSAMKEWLLVL